MYEKLVIEDTGCPEADAPAVVEMMRVERPTLDSLRRPQFRSLARRAWEAVKECRRCPACGDEGPHQDNGERRATRVTYCCRKCGEHFDAIPV